MVFLQARRWKNGRSKYLDEWPDIYYSCHIIENLGAGIAPWNYSQYQIFEKNGHIKINNENLIFYHFHQFKIFSDNSFFRLGDIYKSNAKEPDSIYSKYEKRLKIQLNKIRKIDPDFNDGMGLDNHHFCKFIKNVFT